jgi:pimeloyl-ACP methyl ester carboxylesterase
VTEAATLVLVHGAWSGSWSWWKLTPILDELGVPYVAVDLPSCSAPDTSVDIHDDAAHVRATAAGLDRPVVLVGNSYGGVVITEGGLDVPNATRLVYLAAHMPDAGESLITVMSGTATDEFGSAVSVLPDGRMRLDPDVVVRAAVQQAPDTDRDVMRARLAPAMSMGTDLAMTFARVAWRELPSTYVVCADDRSLDPDAQREWAKQRATDHVELPFDHCPQVSHPREVAELLAGIACSAG